MSHDITLEEAALKAEQLEVICGLMVNYPNEFEDREVTVLAALLRSLSAGVGSWLSEEKYQREEACHVD